MHYPIKKFLIAFSILLLFSSGCSKKQPVKEIYLPKGWYLSLNNSRVTPTSIFEKKESHRIDFERQNAPKGSAYYIRVAEAIFPHRKMILTAKRDLKNGSSVTGSWYFERLWWHEMYQGYRIPFAVTGDTINYYLDQFYLTKKAVKAEKTGNPWKASNQNRIEYYYSAKVRSNKNKDLPGSANSGHQSGLTIVTLKIKWQNRCGQGCGWGFEKSREIWFSDKHTVIKIKGDGVEGKWKSSTKTKNSPEEWITF